MHQQKNIVKTAVSQSTNGVNGINDSHVDSAADPITDKAVKHLASSIFRHLQSEGCMPKDIISVSTQLLDLVTTELKRDVSPQ